MTSECRSFAPSAAHGAKVLILGSMPGAASLRQQQYYAFKHNAFWPIMGEIFSFSPHLPYPARLQILQDHAIALWDVCASCERAGSLDAAIRHPVPNDIAALLAQYPTIEKICCNGTAASRYLRRFFPELTRCAVTLPSTSPAAARCDYAAKLRRWQAELPSGEKDSPRTGDPGSGGETPGSPPGRDSIQRFDSDHTPN